jgi:Sec-independent protein translocase protein TatA
MIKNKEDFMVLAKVYNRLSNNEQSVTKFAKYKDKEDNVNETESAPKTPKKKAKTIQKQDPYSNMSVSPGYQGSSFGCGFTNIEAQNMISNLMNPSSMVQHVQAPAPVDSTQKLKIDQEKVMFNTQLISMVQNIYTSITSFKQEINERMDQLMSKMQSNEDEKENMPIYRNAYQQSNHPSLAEIMVHHNFFLYRFSGA